MKKIITTFIAVAMAVGASAATINWSAEIFNSRNGGADSGSGTFYIFALGGSSQSFGADDFTITYTDATLTTISSVALTGATLMNTDNYKIDMGSSYWESGEVSIVFGNIPPIKNDTLNQWWAIVLVDNATKDYYGVSVFEAKDIGDMTNIFDAFQPALVDVAQHTLVTNIVPEPLTVGLALAGVALLIAQRRRK